VGKSLCLIAILTSFAGVASADTITTILCNPKDPLASKLPMCNKAPEINPASALAGLTLLAGGLIVLRSRRVRHDA
jgi:LPXTG-motif cell wall-anchored protein